MIVWWNVVFDIYVSLFKEFVIDFKKVVGWCDYLCMFIGVNVVDM